MKSGKPIEPNKEYVVAGWASVNEGTEGPPVWDLVERYIAAEKTVRVAPNTSVKISGALAAIRITFMKIECDKSRPQGIRREVPMTDPTDRRAPRAAAFLLAPPVLPRRARRAPRSPTTPRTCRRMLPDWTRQLGEGVGVRAYGNPSKYEKDVVRRTVSWLTATPESSVSFTPLHQLDGIITPNGLCFERHHGGIAEIDPHDYRLMLHGLVDKPLIFTLDELKRLPRVNKIHFLECAANSGMEWRGAQLNGCQYTHGMVHCVQYTGVPLKVLLEQAGLKPNAKWIMAEGGDAAAMNRSIPIGKALDDCIVAYRMNGEMLRPEQGYPVRLVVPGWEGNVWVKWLRRIKVGDQPWYTREETSKYTDLLENGKARQFTFVMDAKSVITSPSPQAPVKQKGFNVISGLAWSGPRQGQAGRRFARRRPQLAHARASTARFSTRPACASTTSSTGTAKSCCCSRAPWTTPAMCSRARTPCARSAASIRSTTTTASRPGRSSRTGRSRMSRSARLAFSVAAAVRARRAGAGASARKMRRATTASATPPRRSKLPAGTSTCGRTGRARRPATAR